MVNNKEFIYLVLS